jgi:hypothetical protein
MDIQPKVLAWLKDTKPEWVLAEGDRLANTKFFLAVQELGYDLTLVYLSAPPTVATARRERRAAMLADKKVQNLKWVQGRITKVRNLIADVRFKLVVVEADHPAMHVASALAIVVLGGA